MVLFVNEACAKMPWACGARVGLVSPRGQASGESSICAGITKSANLRAIKWLVWTSGMESVKI